MRTLLRSARIRRAVTWLMGLALVGGAIVWGTASGRRTPGASHPPSVLVTPFQGPDDGDGALGADLAARLETAAMRQEGLEVRPWRRTRRSPAASESAAQALAREAHAQYALVGTLTRRGDRVMVVARLLQAGGSGVAWTGTYWREDGDLASLPEELALAVADALRAPARGADPAR